MIEHIVPDTSDDGPYRIDAEHAPPTPPGFGPGRWVRDPEARGWRWQLPDRRQPPPDSERPIVICRWFDRATDPEQATMILTRHVNLRRSEISLRIGRCLVKHWDEYHDKRSPGEILLDRRQAEYLRDALTAMLERKP